VYITGEAIRGLADLEAKERERCANFATKAIAAGLAERTVRVAELRSSLVRAAASALPTATATQAATSWANSTSVSSKTFGCPA
jgi:hypothetical protein